MPLILERKDRSAAHQPHCNQRRLSNIPRSLKSLVLDTNSAGISHASKPTLERLPLVTPAKLDPQFINKSQQQRSLASNKSSIPNKHATSGMQQINRDHPGSTLTQMDNDPEVAILELIPFSRQPTVNFGNVNLGCTRIRYAILRNSSQIQQQMKVVSFPKADKGFYIDATEFLIAPKAEICVGLAWTPKAAGGVRESITLHDANRMSWRIVLTGTGVVPKAQLPFQNRSSRGPVPRLYRRLSPTKLNRQTISERNKLVFSPYRQSANRRPHQVKPLTKLRQPSPNKKSQIVRKILSKKDGDMAVKIQSYCRMYLARKELEERRKLILSLQSRVRGYLARKAFERKHKAAVVLQSHWRSKIARRELERLKNFQRAVTLLQAHFRGNLVRRQLELRRTAVILLQTLWRVQLAKRELARLKRIKQSVVFIQSKFRAHLCRKDFIRKRQAAIVIQSHWRAIIARQELKRLQNLQQAVIKIQALARGRSFRRRLQLEKEAAIVLQSYWRRKQAKKELERLRSLKQSTVWLQSRIRGFIKRTDFRRKRQASIVLQSHWRAKKARDELKRLKLLNQAVTRFQAHARGRYIRRIASHKKSAAIAIQCWWRIQMAKRELTRLKRFKGSVIWLQSQVRGYLVRRRLKRSVEAIYRIQLQSFRGTLMMN